MAETVTVSWIDGRAILFLNQVHELPATNWKKLCRLLHQFPELNGEPLRLLPAWFEEAIHEAERETEEAKDQYKAVYVNQAKAPRGEKLKTREQNDALKRAVSRSVSKTEKLKKRYLIFKEIVEE